MSFYVWTCKVNPCHPHFLFGYLYLRITQSSALYLPFILCNSFLFRHGCVRLRVLFSLACSGRKGSFWNTWLCSFVLKLVSMSHGVMASLVVFSFLFVYWFIAAVDIKCSYFFVLGIWVWKKFLLIFWGSGFNLAFDLFGSWENMRMEEEGREFVWVSYGVNFKPLFTNFHFFSFFWEWLLRSNSQTSISDSFESEYYAHVMKWRSFFSFSFFNLEFSLISEMGFFEFESWEGREKRIIFLGMVLAYRSTKNAGEAQFNGYKTGFEMVSWRWKCMWTVK